MSPRIDMDRYADMLLGYWGVKETIAEAKPDDSYNAVLVIAQRITKNTTEGGYSYCVADRAHEWLSLQRRRNASEHG